MYESIATLVCVKLFSNWYVTQFDKLLQTYFFKTANQVCRYLRDAILYMWKSTSLAFIYVFRKIDFIRKL